MHTSKGAHRNMLKVYDFTKNRLCRKCVDNKLQKMLRTNIVENGTGQILLTLIWVAFLGVRFEVGEGGVKVPSCLKLVRIVQET